MKKNVAIILLLMFSLLHSLGTLRVESIKELPATHKNLETYDADGKFAPVLLVKTALKGLGIQNIGRPTKHAPQYITGDHHYKFYMNDNQRVVKITHADYEPLEVRLLADFGINVKAQRVYELILTNKPGKEFINVVIISEPADAIKIIDGKSIGTGQSFEISTGTHILKVKKQGYKTIEKEIEVSKANNLFNNLILQEEEMKSVIIKSVPTNANIFIDGQNAGKLTDKAVWIFPGIHTLRLTKSGYFDIDETIEVKEDIPNEFEFELTKNAGTLQLDIYPENANIYINNIKYSEHDIDLKPGNYNINISKEQYLPYNEEIVITLGETLKRNISLTKNIGILNLEVVPEDSEVRINGSIIYKKMIELIPGYYNVTVSKDQYLQQNEEFSIKLGETINKDFTLIKNVGTLKLEVEPNDAKVLINREQYYGQKEIELTPGPYKIEISKTGYYDESEPFNISLGETITKSYNLKQRVGKLRFSVDPFDAHVILRRDNKTYKSWNGLKYLKSIPVGPYDLLVEHSDFVNKQEKIIINEDQLLEKYIELKPFDETMLMSAHKFEKHKWIGLSSAGALLTLGIISNFIADGYYADYESANTNSDAVSNRDKYERWDKIRDYSYYISVGPLIYGVYSLISEGYYRNRAKEGK